jgi:hypothetical protein
MNDIREMWNTNNQELWDKALKRYWCFVKPENISLEKEMNKIDSCSVKAMNPQEWYNFLLEKFVPWKYTACNRCKTITDNLKKNDLSQLHKVKDGIFTFDKNDIEKGLKITSSIKGLGVAGGSGLLAILFPHYFGTVDQFVVKALRNIPELPDIEAIRKMECQNLKLQDGVVLINIMRNKARDLNMALATNQWTPRRIDIVLWACRPIVSAGGGRH